MKRWTEAQARANNIVDYEQFNNEYNAHKSTLNGGVDRLQVQQDTVTKAMITDYALHRTYYNQHGELSSTQWKDPHASAVALNNTEGEFRGLTYGTYNGGWITIAEQEYTALKDGMVYIEFLSHLFMDVFWSLGNAGTINNKGVELSLEWNGIPLLNSFVFTLPFQTVRLFVNTFTPAGTGNLVVKARMTPKGNTDWIYKVQMNFWNMRTLLIGRGR